MIVLVSVTDDNSIPDLCCIHCRGAIDKVDNILPATVAASLALSEDRKAIVWTIGTMSCSELQHHDFNTMVIMFTQGRSFLPRVSKYPCKLQYIFTISLFSPTVMTLSALDSMLTSM